MAKFIQLKDGEEKHICNICSDTIEDNKIIGLKCNPSKHIFCYECIRDWYKELKKKKSPNNYKMITMCPICMKNGGLLPQCSFDKSIKDIHLGYIEPTIENIKLSYKCCNAKLKSKDGYCKARGQEKYGWLCGTHVKCKNVIVGVETNEDLSSNTTSQPAIIL
jgi:hypothetical protein